MIKNNFVCQVEQRKSFEILHLDWNLNFVWFRNNSEWMEIVDHSSHDEFLWKKSWFHISSRITSVMFQDVKDIKKHSFRLNQASGNIKNIKIMINSKIDQEIEQIWGKRPWKRCAFAVWMFLLFFWSCLSKRCEALSLILTWYGRWWKIRPSTEIYET